VFIADSAGKGELSSSGAGLDDEGVALEDEVGEMGVLKVEGVPGAAVCLLLVVSIHFSSPSSSTADAGWTSCFLVMLPGLGQDA